MALDIAGSTALITGGAKRIGRATAMALASAGANVLIHYRSSASEAEELAEAVRIIGPSAWTLQADLSDQQQLGQLLNRAVEIAGPVQILINNASAFPKVDFNTVSLQDVIASVTTDAWAPFALGRQFARMPQAKHIVNMLDTRIFADYDWQHFSYNAAKHMLGLFTKMMAIKLAPNVAVNGVAPGLILPPEGMPESYIEDLKNELPMKRIGSPEFVAEAVLYLVKSEYVTGQVIFVDGGRHLNEGGFG